MSASFQAFPQQGPPAQGMVYPTTATTTSDTQGGSSDHSSGSFGMVFVVLAIILVVSAVACVLGRVCSKKANKSSHEPKAHKQKHGKNNHGHGPHGHDHGHKHMSHPSNPKNNHHGSKHGSDRFRDPDLEFGYRSKEGDIMMGFDAKAKMPSAKVANHGDFRGGNGMDMGNMGMGRGTGMGMGPGMGMNPGMGMGPGMGPGMGRQGSGRSMQHPGEQRDY